MGKVFKRLLVFLTVFLTSPAFAQADNAHACLNPNANGDCGFIPDGDSTADCGPVPLTFEGNSPNSGTYYLTAQYEQDAYDVYYYRGTCEGDGNPSKYNDVGHYGPTDGYTILPASTSSASQLHGIYAPNNKHFVNWSAYWVDKEVCEEGASSVGGAYLQSKSSVFPAGHYNAANDTADNDNSWNPGSFNWYDTNKNCLLLVGNCVADDSYTVTYKNGTCYDGTAIEWTDPTTTYLNGTYTIPGATNTNITAVYSEGNDKEFTGWKLVWAASGAENNTKDYDDSITWAHAENLVLEAQCRDKDVHTVTYVANSCETNNNRVVYTNSDIIDGTEYSAYETDSAAATERLNVRDGYTYVGWATKANPTLGSNNQIPVADQWAAGTAVTEDVTLYAICVPIDYKLEYNCGVDPDTGSAIGGTAPSTRTGIHVEDSDVVTAATPTQCNNGLLEFDHWRCVKKDHNTGSDAGVFGTNGEFGAGVSLTNSWPAYDGLCTAMWNNPVLTCPSSHPEHDVEVVTSYTQCYRITTTDSCDKRGEETVTQDDHCVYAANCSCEMVTYRVYANEQGNADSDVIKSEDGTQVLSSVPEPYCTREIVAGTQPIGAELGYEYDPQRGTCEAIPTYPVRYDCGNNGLGTDGNGTKPTDADSPYAANASVTVLNYPAGCKEPTERIADATLGWECVGENGDPVYSGSGNATFTMPAQSVTCTAKWKSTAYNIRYVGCQCNNPAVPLESECNLDPSLGSVKGRDITNRVVSGENETNDKSKYYRTYTATRNVKFPQIVGTQYGQIDVAANAFGYSWFVFNRNGESRTKTWAWDVDKNPSSGGITVYTCLGDSYQVTYNCIRGARETYIDGPYQKTTIQTRGYYKSGSSERTCSYNEPGWTFKWNCGGTSLLTPGNSSLVVDSDKVCDAEWNCANGYEYDSATGQCVKKYTLKFKCDNGFSGENPIREEKLSENATFDTNSVPKCTTKPCSEAVDKDTWICKKDNNGQPVSVGDDGVLTMPAADVTCTAQWTPVTYTVTYNTGSCGSDGHTDETVYTSQNVTCGSNYTVESAANSAMNNVLKSDYTLEGWNTQSGTNWTGEIINSNITVYAACKCKDGYVMNNNGQCEKVYTVTYQVGNCAASGAPYTDNSQLQSGVSYTVKDFADVKSSWSVGSKMKFIKWTGDNNAEYLDSDRSNWTFAWNGTSDLVLTADCEDTSFECPDGYNEHYDERFTDVTGCYKVVEVPCEQQDGQVPEHCKDPVWEACKCTQEVKYRVYAADANGTPGIMTDSTGTPRTTIPSAPTCTKTLGEETGAETGYSFDIETQTCPEESYELEYDCANGEKGGDHTEQHAYEDSITGLDSQKDCVVPSDTQEFDYYECVPTQGSLIEAVYNNDTQKIVSFKMPDTKVICTAHWKNKKYSVTYNCTDGTVKDGERPGTRGTVTEDNKTEIIEGITYNEDRFTFTKVDDECELAGHTATGWNCNTTLTNTDYTGSNKWSRKFDVVCNAQWQVKEFELIYDCNNKSAGGTAPVGGTHAVGEQNVKVESGKGSCKAPKGQHFVRWICESLQTDDITGYYDDAQTKIEYFTMPEHNVLCKGKWEDSTENINYVGCVGGDCVIRCDNSGNCTSVSLYSQCSEILNLNDYVDSDKLTYSNTNMVTFPIYNENPTNDLESQGYNFDGNWCKPDNMRACASISNTSLQSGPLTVCTILEPYYRVTYDCDWNHTAPVDDTRYKSGQDVSVKTGSDCGDGNRPGYTFTKWSCQPEGGTAFDRNSGQGFQIEANTKCTAQWKKKKYKVTYDCTEQSKKPGATMQYNVNYDEEHSVASVDEKCSYDGYTFNGWVCKKVKAGDVLGTYRCPASQASDPSCKDSPIRWDFDDNLKCDALWDENHYDVIYDKGQCGDTTGTVYTDSRGAATGKTYTVPDVATTLMNDAMKTGYTFKGWNTVSGQTEGNWTGESPWTRTSNLTVYAACEANKYDVIYNKGNCVKDNGDSYVHKNGATYGERYNAFAGGNSNAKPYIYAGTGYTFRGWNTEPGQEVANWTGENPWERTSSLNVYAVCTPNTYNIRYRNNTCGEAPGLGNIHSDEVEFDENYTLKSLPIEWTTGTNNTVERSIYVPDGYKFIGWKSLTTLAEPDYQDGYTFEPWNRTETLELFAECVEEDYHVTYDCDTLDNPYDSSNSCDADDPTGCRTPVDNTPYHINNTVPVPLNEANTCKKTGYHFDKWLCYAEDNEHTELPISSITNRFGMLAANAKCTAQWIEDEYHVFYNCDSGTSCNNSDTTGCRTPEDNTAYHYDADVITSDNQLNGQDACVKVGHYPTLWACDGGYKTEEVVPGDDFEDIRQDTTCTMQWEPYKYDVTYKAGTCGGTENVFRQSAVYGKTFEIKNITDTDMGNLYIQTGYEFLGWSKSPVNEDEVEADGFAVDYVARDVSDTVEDNVTLYAVCKKKIYNICYDFQIDGANWKDANADPLYSYTIDTGDSRDYVIAALHTDNNVGNFYVFDGWYSNPEGTGNKIESLPGDNLRENPPTSSVLVERTDRIAAQWDEDGFANCDVMVYAKWKPAGKIKFECTAANSTTTKEAVGGFVKARRACGGICTFEAWHCDNYTGNPKDYQPGEFIEVLVPNTTVVCRPEKDCSGVERDINYEVYDADTGERIDTVYVGDSQVDVNELTPDTYTTAEAVYYPEISLPDCVFVGDSWYEDRDFTKKTEHTPVAPDDIAIDKEPGDITVYGKMLCGFHCNEPGHEHWFHIGNNPNDKVCLYEEKPHTKDLPFVRVKGKEYNKPYYMMLSEDPDMIIHEGSQKSMRIQYNGKIYNVCDKSSCPDL